MTTLNKQAYTALVEQDLEYLNKHCREGDLELDHIKAVLCKSIDLLYPDTVKYATAAEIIEHFKKHEP